MRDREYEWFHPRKRLEVYLVTRRYRFPELKRSAHIEHHFWRRKNRQIYGEWVVVKTTATLDPAHPRSNRHKRFYYTVRGSGRDWDYGELMGSREWAIHEKYETTIRKYEFKRQLSFS